jgi:serine protease Do
MIVLAVVWPAYPELRDLPANPELVQARLGMKVEGRDSNQVVVRDVRPRGPAAKAGVEAGDVVVFVDDQLVGSAGEVAKLVARVKPGCVVALDLLRAGRPVLASVRVASTDK